ncbi:MAG: dienelactone hydrolase family protein [Dehalococcoidales bacterium]|nr:dienelactone hydrolase family protein [Dehalococcoidales bacterium]
MTENPVKFPCGDITLEGIFHLPDDKSPFPVVIMCHPHPLYGGDMYHPIVYDVCEELARNSIAALRYNFRGVEGSGGTYGEGITEQEDVRAAIAFALSQPNIDKNRLGLAGYSFGASTIVPVAVNDTRVNLLALISPVFEPALWNILSQYQKPKIIVAGEDDQYAPSSYLEKMIKKLPQPLQYHIIKNADHFWDGYETEVARKVSDFFVKGFKV